MANNTDQFFELVERTFSVDEITAEDIMDKFYSGTFGDVEGGWYKSGKKRTQKSQATLSGQSLFRGLAERLAEGREVVEEIERVEDFDELRRLRNRAKELDIHSKEVTKRVESKMNIISKELEKISEERKERRLVEEKAEKDLVRETDKIEKAASTITLERIGRRLILIDKQGIDISDELSLLEGKKASIEAQEEEINPDF